MLMRTKTVFATTMRITQDNVHTADGDKVAKPDTAPQMARAVRICNAGAQAMGGEEVDAA